jgi:hypothetical protein
MGSPPLCISLLFPADDDPKTDASLPVALLAKSMEPCYLNLQGLLGLSRRDADHAGKRDSGTR